MKLLVSVEDVYNSDNEELLILPSESFEELIFLADIYTR
jgi:hypothetical protein